jgi:DNA-binding MarR family transcriptional regulator
MIIREIDSRKGKDPVRKRVLQRIAKGRTYQYQIHRDLGISIGAVHQAVEALERGGCISRCPREEGRIFFEITKKGEMVVKDWERHKALLEDYLTLPIGENRVLCLPTHGKRFEFIYKL